MKIPAYPLDYSMPIVRARLFAPLMGIPILDSMYNHQAKTTCYAVGTMNYPAFACPPRQSFFRPLSYGNNHRKYWEGWNEMQDINYYPSKLVEKGINEILGPPSKKVQKWIPVCESLPLFSRRFFIRERCRFFLMIVLSTSDLMAQSSVVSFR